MMEKIKIPDSGLELDQHFMTDAVIVRKIVAAADIKPEETVLEIGAGTGFLTSFLAAEAKKVIAIEIDKKLRPLLAKELRDFRNVKIIAGNALKKIENLEFDKIVSNLPYAICEPLVQKLRGKKFSLAVLSVSKSFAYRLAAKPADRNYSRLSKTAQKYFDIEILFQIPKDAFYPKPKSNSVVLRLIPKKR